MNKKLLMISTLITCIPVLIINSNHSYVYASDNIPIVESIETETELELEIKSEITEPDIFEIAAKEYINKINEFESTENKMQWFIEYKELINKYSDVLDTPETIYNYYTEDELNRLFGVVEAEVGGLGGFDERCNVASVIFNRIESDKFKNTMNEVLSKKQFTTISNGRYKDVNITEETILACEYAFSIGDTTNGALFFESGDNNVHSNYATYMFTDDAGHKFYK